ncbi:unnamed protein product [Didymodactylos carnosus]|uniref:Uncharacterized protein n=1 Tax=Didymodactylos carnosus TaxID=1234261 RepID=A0A814GI73_9BILA|nr:unnamed protein product [Didymodactylos carnosus]CAF0996662.1 unnamed protein product [Didymodactylos carnosus]CAF3714823.1 unnamed protein product [Didymodactylos carnosus]CAF3768250.1 unnamed protein product [Didymodactylos carnosus]
MAENWKKLYRRWQEQHKKLKARYISSSLPISSTQQRETFRSFRIKRLTTTTDTKFEYKRQSLDVTYNQTSNFFTNIRDSFKIPSTKLRTKSIIVGSVNSNHFLHEQINPR